MLHTRRALHDDTLLAEATAGGEATTAELTGSQRPEAPSHEGGGGLPNGALPAKATAGGEAAAAEPAA